MSEVFTLLLLTNVKLRIIISAANTIMLVTVSSS